MTKGEGRSGGSHKHSGHEGGGDDGDDDGKGDGGDGNDEGEETDDPNLHKEIDRARFRGGLPATPDLYARGRVQWYRLPGSLVRHRWPSEPSEPTGTRRQADDETIDGLTSEPGNRYHCTRPRAYRSGVAGSRPGIELCRSPCADWDRRFPRLRRSRRLRPPCRRHRRHRRHLMTAVFVRSPGATFALRHWRPLCRGVESRIPTTAIFITGERRILSARTGRIYRASPINRIRYRSRKAGIETVVVDPSEETAVSGVHEALADGYGTEPVWTWDITKLATTAVGVFLHA